jgi:hypothetical protein
MVTGLFCASFQLTTPMFPSCWQGLGQALRTSVYVRQHKKGQLPNAATNSEPLLLLSVLRFSLIFPFFFGRLLWNANQMG